LTLALLAAPWAMTQPVAVASGPCGDAVKAGPFGDRAVRMVATAGSVVEVLTGRLVEASGEAEADFRWDGCRWRRTGLRY
jgi:hypothetical protein